MYQRLPRLTLFPYTTLFRSPRRPARHPEGDARRPRDAGPLAAARGGVLRQDPEGLDRGRPSAIIVPMIAGVAAHTARSEEHTSELQSRRDLVCRLLLEKKKN